jgi:hypothetical protein
MTLPTDTILENRYRIEGLLAQGGMGAIYRGYDITLDIPVAIKENFFQTPEGMRQFQQEARILARLHHRGLPRVINHFSLDGRQYLVMDFIEGQDLWEIVTRRGQPLGERKALDFLIQVCEAVDYLHRQNPPIIHRDIKPQNIKITPDGRAVLVDFGIAKVTRTDALTDTGARGVTSGFSPPEQYTGSGTSPASDIYALGATLYAILTGQKPPDSVSLAAGEATFEPPDRLNPRLSRAVSQAIEHAMRVQRADRPASVTLWQQTLITIRDNLPPHEDTVILPSSPVVAWLVDAAGQGHRLKPGVLIFGPARAEGTPPEQLLQSPYHVKIEFDGQNCTVFNPGASLEIAINDQPISPNGQPLSFGDRLRIGTAIFTFSSIQPQKASHLPSILLSSSNDQTETAYVPIQIAAAPVSATEIPPVRTVDPGTPASTKAGSTQKWWSIVAVIAILVIGAVVLPWFIEMPPKQGLVTNEPTLVFETTEPNRVVTPVPTQPTDPSQPTVTAMAIAASPTVPLEPIAPLVVQTIPERGAELPLDAPVEISFDQPMDRASVEKAFAIEPGASIDGILEWVDDQTLRFKLKDGWQRGQRYRVRLAETAQGQAGLVLLRPFELRFNAAGFLEVTNTQPATATTEVKADSAITVFFNRPVVPLGAIESGGTLPNPLTLVPPVTGTGEWLNTAIYQFTPATPGLAPATEYIARVAGGLRDVTGQAVLENDFEWHFITVSPAVVGSVPAANDLYVSPTPAISVTFNQKMDRRSVEENLTLVKDDSGESVPGSFVWGEVGMLPPLPMDEFGNIIYEYDQFGQPIPPKQEPVGVETVIFRPGEPLELGAVYRVELPRGVKAAQSQAQTTSAYNANFTVSPPPAVLSTNPPDGEQFADPFQGLNITFNGPISPATVIPGQTLIFEPAISATEVYTYWSQNDTQVNISFPRQENKVYTVTLTSGVAGRYGQPLQAETTVRWQTYRQTPYVRIVSPSIATYNGYRAETYVYMTVRNVSQVNLALYRLSKDEFATLSQNVFAGIDDYNQWESFVPPQDRRVGEWSQPTDPELYENYVYKVDVSQAVANGQPLAPGLYFLVAQAAPSGIFPEAQGTDLSQASDRQLLIVSKRNLTLKQGQGDALALLTDLQSGQPVSEVPVTFVANQQNADQSQTDATGVATGTFSYLPNEPLATLLAFAGNPDQADDNFAVGSSTWSSGINAYEFEGLYPGFGGFGSSFGYTAYLYTERLLYRPGQTVNFKGIIRADDDARYSLPTAASTATVQIFDFQGRQVYNQELPLNEWSTFNGSLKLGDQAGLGAYSIQVQYEGAGFYGQFQVAAYRKPDYVVSVVTDKAEYRQGDTIKVSASAEFFSGGPVSNAKVRWTLLTEPYAFQYQGSGTYDFLDSDELRRRPDQFIYGFNEAIANGEGMTDGEGRFTFELPADIATRLASQLFTIDVAITDISNQEVATQAKAIVHKGDFYVGLRPQRYVTQTGQESPIEVLVVDWDSQPVANQAVELVAAEYNFYSVQQYNPESNPNTPDDDYYWENIVETQAVFTTTATTDQEGKAVANFSPSRAGNYKIYARAIDRNRQEVRSATFLWVSGAGYVNWGQADNDRVELVTDQRQYSVGDTATILIPHPFSGTVTALVTLERGHIYQHFLQELKTNSDQLQIPITEDLIPNIYVSVVIVKGMDETNSLPGFKLGYVRLPINPKEKQLTITLTPSAPEHATYQPQEAVDYQVTVSDVAGQPVKAELSLALIDKAVLTLQPDKPGQLLETFWYQRALNVQTGVGLTLALDRINRALDEKKGGGGGDGFIGPDSVRQNFADTALWVADFVTDENGQGNVTVTLPDNLTTWVMIAKGVTGANTLVGENRVEIISSKPLLVRPATPRFFVIGDEAVLGLIVQNNSEQRQEVEASFVAEGLEIGEWRLGSGAWMSQGTPQVSVNAGERVKIEYKVKAAEAEVARLTMGAKSIELSDAVAFELPIYHLSTPETVATVGVLAEDGARLEGVALPASFEASQGDLTVKVDPTLAAGMRAGLRYLEHFPHECVEQTVSRFLPNIFTYRAYQKLKLENPELAQRLPGLVSAGLQRLYSQQHLDGGWGWWSADSSDPFVTAYVLLGLVEARRSDFTVDQGVIDTAVGYLQGSLVAPKDIAAPWQGNRQAFILYVLAEAGQSDFSRSAALFEQRDLLDNYGKAFLALSLHLADPAARQIDTLLADLTDAAIVSATGVHWEEQTADYYAMNTDIRTTAIVLAALTRIQPDLPTLPNAVRWLMTVREKGGHWQTTQETAWAIIGLTDWMIASGELAANYAWNVSLNGQELGQGQVDQANLTDTTELRVVVQDLVADAVNRLTVERNPTLGQGQPDETGRLYYAAYLTYFKPVQEVKALDRGIVVSRQYFYQPLAAGPEENRNEGPITEANIGDFVRVKLTVVAPTDLHYVLIEDPFPAGMEGVDSSLATTSLVGQPPTGPLSGKEQGWGWWYFSHTELRDEKAVLFATYLPKGTYEYTYTLRASIPGVFKVVPTHAEQMYFPEVFGRSDGGLFKVLEQ